MILIIPFIPDWPITAWVILLAASVFAGEYVLLLVRRNRSRASGDLAEARLSRVATALKEYARGHDNQLPASLQELNAADIAHVVYRPITRLDLDEKLVLLHDAQPTHKIIEFPALREGRGLVFCSGKMHIVSEEILDKLLFADDALRERLGLGAVVRSADADAIGYNSKESA